MDIQKVHWNNSENKVNFSFQLFVHVGVKRELLHVLVLAHLDKAFSTFVIAVPEVLHDAQHPKDGAMVFHKHFSRQLQGFGVASAQQAMRGLQQALMGIRNQRTADIDATLAVLTDPAVKAKAVALIKDQEEDFMRMMPGGDRDR